MADDLSPLVFQCTRCGLPASLGAGINVSVLATHLPMVDGEAEQAEACSAAGGPFDGEVTARQLETAYRERVGLPFLRT